MYEVLRVITPWLTLTATAIIAVIGFFIRGAWADLKSFKKDLEELKENILENYTKRDDFHALEKEERVARKELWTTINRMKVAMAKSGMDINE